MQVWLQVKGLICLLALAVCILLVWLSIGAWTVLDTALANVQSCFNKALEERFFD